MNKKLNEKQFSTNSSLAQLLGLTNKEGKEATVNMGETAHLLPLYIAYAYALTRREIVNIPTTTSLKS